MKTFLLYGSTGANVAKSPSGHRCHPAISHDCGDKQGARERVIKEWVAISRKVRRLIDCRASLNRIVNAPTT